MKTKKTDLEKIRVWAKKNGIAHQEHADKYGVRVNLLGHAIHYTVNGDAYDMGLNTKGFDGMVTHTKIVRQLNREVA